MASSQVMRSSDLFVHYTAYLPIYESIYLSSCPCLTLSAHLSICLFMGRSMYHPIMSLSLCHVVRRSVVSARMFIAVCRLSPSIPLLFFLLDLFSLLSLSFPSPSSLCHLLHRSPDALSAACPVPADAFHVAVLAAKTRRRRRLLLPLRRWR